MFGKIAVQWFPPSVVAAFRALGAALALHALARYRGGGGLPASLRDRVRLAACGLLGVTLNQLLFLHGVSRTSAISAAILITTIPIFTAVFASAFGVEPLSARKSAGIAVALIGVAILLPSGSARAAGSTTLGNVLIVLNCMFYGMFLVLSHPLRARMDSVTMSAWVFTFGGALVVPLGLASSRGFQWSAVGPAGWAALAYAVVFASMLGYWLNLWALPRSGPTLLALYTYVQPLIASVLSVPMLGETLRLQHAASAVFIFAGVYLASSDARATPEPELV